MMEPPLPDNSVLRASTPHDLSRIFQAAAARVGEAPISASLLESVAAYALPPSVFSPWLCVCRDPASLLDALRQPHSVRVRELAIRTLGRWARSAEYFPPLWRALGGVDGTMKLFASLPVGDVAGICRALGCSATAQGAMEERRLAITGLVRALYGLDDDSIENPDYRDLRREYRHLVPACTAELALGWNEGSTMTDVLDGKLWNAHLAAFRERCLSRCFPSSSSGRVTTETAEGLSNYRALLASNLPLAAECISRLANRPAYLEQQEPFFLWALFRLSCHLAVTRRYPRAFQERIFCDVTVCLRALPHLITRLGFEIGSLIWMAAKLWERKSRIGDGIESILLSLLSLVPIDDKGEYLEQIATLVVSIRKPIRYRLLKLVFMHTKQYALDLEDQSDVGKDKLGRIKGRWPAAIFLDTPVVPMVRLLSSLVSLFPDGSFLAYAEYSESPSIFNSIPNHPSYTTDADIFYDYVSANLGKGNPVDRPQSIVSIAERKRKSENATDWTIRTGWATSAIFLSIASGEVQKYRAIQLWCRRFIKDSQTMSALCGQTVLHTKEGVDLLTGFIPYAQFTPQATAEALRAAVETANQTILDFYQLPVLASREPGFQWYNWNSVRNLPRVVAERRLQNLRNLSKRLRLNDKQLFTAILEPTVDLLVETEVFWMKLEHGASTHPPSRVMILSGVRSGSDPLISCFVDAIAQRRDAIWRDYRLGRNPAVGTFSPPWPRGLPIQDLCSVTITGGDDLPYLQKRAQEVVFMSTSQALAPFPEEELGDAIGLFVESYSFALKLYVKNHNLGGEESDRRVRKAWYHALHQLTGQRMSRTEAIGFWRRRFQTYLPDIDITGSIAQEVSELERPPPKLPQRSDSDETSIKWNPDPYFQRPVLRKQRTLSPVTSLDAMLQIHTVGQGIWGEDPNDYSWRLASTIDLQMPRVIWKFALEKPAGITSTRDSISAAALLSLNDRFGVGSCLLEAPYPSPQDPRFPGVCLDSRFLNAHPDHQDISSMLHVLKSTLESLPVPFLEELTRSALAWLDSNPLDATAVQAVMKTARLLSSSDYPYHACSFVKYIIMQRPEDSAWHRQLLRASFLRKLLPQQAEEFMNDLAETAIKRFELLEETRITGAETRNASVEEASAKQPHIRISTVKLLVSVFSRSKAISDGFVIGFLTSILKSTQHIDIWKVVVAELLSILAILNEGDELEEEIFLILEKYIVPRVAAIDERRPPSEDEWAKAENEGNMKNLQWTARDKYIGVSRDSDKVPLGSTDISSRVLLNTLWEWFIINRANVDSYLDSDDRDSRDNNSIGEQSPPWDVSNIEYSESGDDSDTGDESNKDEDNGEDWAETRAGRFLNRILLPAIEESMDTAERWIPMFLRSNGLTVPEGGFPSIPVAPQILNKLVSELPEHLTPILFESLQDLVLFNARSSMELVDTCLNLRIVSPVNSSPGAEQYLSVWGRQGGDALTHGASRAALLLSSNFWSSRAARRAQITVKQIQDFLLRVADVYLASGDLDAFDSLMAAVSDKQNSTSRVGYYRFTFSRSAWTAHSRPLVSLLVDKVIAFQMFGPPQIPKPDPMYMRVTAYLMLPQPDSLDYESEWKEFVEDVRNSVELIGRIEGPYHTYYEGIRDIVRLVGGSETERKQIAFAISHGAQVRDTDVSPLSDYLKVDLAWDLFVKAGGWGEGMNAGGYARRKGILERVERVMDGNTGDGELLLGRV